MGWVGIWSNFDRLKEKSNDNILLVISACYITKLKVSLLKAQFEAYDFRQVDINNEGGFR